MDYVPPIVDNVQVVIEEVLPFVQSHGGTWRYGERAGKPKLDSNRFFMPEIVVVSREHLQRLFASMLITENSNPDGTIPGIAAMYDHRTHTMYLHNELNLVDVRDRSTVVHELVHHMQYIVGLYSTAECDQSPERLAYGIQIEYLLDADYADDDYIRGLKWNKVLYSSCRHLR